MATTRSTHCVAILVNWVEWIWCREIESDKMTNFNRLNMSSLDSFWFSTKSNCVELLSNTNWNVPSNFNSFYVFVIDFHGRSILGQCDRIFYLINCHSSWNWLCLLFYEWFASLGETLVLLELFSVTDGRAILTILPTPTPPTAPTLDNVHSRISAPQMTIIQFSIFLYSLEYTH